MRRLAIATASVLALWAGSALANVTDNGGVPQFQPVILGEVTAVTAHTVTVTTGTSEQMAFEFDSRSMKPTDLAVGDQVRVEFRLLDSGLHFAQRVTTLTPGSIDWNTLQEERKAPSSMNEDEDRDSDDANRAGSMSNNDTESPSDRAEDRQEATASGTSPSTPEPTSTTTTTTTTDRDERETLPATASEIPWLFVVGILVLGAATGMWLTRRRSA